MASGALGGRRADGRGGPRPAGQAGRGGAASSSTAIRGPSRRPRRWRASSATPASDLDAVLLVDVPEDELVRRALLRGRADDREEVIRERLRVYREKTEPLIGYYRERGLLREIDGNRPVEDVTAQMFAALGVDEGSLMVVSRPRARSS